MPQFNRDYRKKKYVPQRAAKNFFPAQDIRRRARDIIRAKGAEIFMRLIVGMTGASGVVIAVELLRRLKTLDAVETHLIITQGAELTIRDET